MSAYTDMVYSQVAAWLEKEIEDLENENAGLSTFFSISDRNLCGKDQEKLVKAAKSEAMKLRKKANGCPSRIWDWQSHFNG